MGKQFEAGDLVQLKSGSPLMTVSQVNQNGVQCMWFVAEGGEAASKVYDAWFEPSMLVLRSI